MTPAAQDTDDYILHNTSTGLLFWNAVGNGAGAALAFASIASLAAVTSADFMVI